jgi:hypothetical protein
MRSIGISDTRPEAKKKLLNLIKQKSIKERLLKVQSLSSVVIQISKRAISRVNPAKK